MAFLWTLPIGDLAKQYDTKVFFETGTGSGDGLQHARQFPFEKLYSVEIHKKSYIAAVQRFADEPRISIIRGHSSLAMQNFLPKIEPNIFFWLDAHFPGSDYHGESRVGEQNLDIRCPLESELKTILALRQGKKDVVCIDDVWLYEEGPFGWGVNKERLKWMAGKTSEFIYDLLTPTHNIRKIMDDTGYIVATPK